MAGNPPPTRRITTEGTLITTYPRTGCGGFTTRRPANDNLTDSEDESNSIQEANKLIAEMNRKPKAQLRPVFTTNPQPSTPNLNSNRSIGTSTMQSNPSPSSVPETTTSDATFPSLSMALDKSYQGINRRLATPTAASPLRNSSLRSALGPLPPPPHAAGSSQGSISSSSSFSRALTPLPSSPNAAEVSQRSSTMSPDDALPIQHGEEQRAPPAWRPIKSLPSRKKVFGVLAPHRPLLDPSPSLHLSSDKIPNTSAESSVEDTKGEVDIDAALEEQDARDEEAALGVNLMMAASTKDIQDGKVPGTAGGPSVYSSPDYGSKFVPRAPVAISLSDLGTRSSSGKSARYSRIALAEEVEDFFWKSATPSDTERKRETTAPANRAVKPLPKRIDAMASQRSSSLPSAPSPAAPVTPTPLSSAPSPPALLSPALVSLSTETSSTRLSSVEEDAVLALNNMANSSPDDYPNGNLPSSSQTGPAQVYTSPQGSQDTVPTVQSRYNVASGSMSMDASTAAPNVDQSSYSTTVSQPYGLLRPGTMQRTPAVQNFSQRYQWADQRYIQISQQQNAFYGQLVGTPILPMSHPISPYLYQTPVPNAESYPNQNWAETRPADSMTPPSLNAPSVRQHPAHAGHSWQPPVPPMNSYVNFQGADVGSSQIPYDQPNFSSSENASARPTYYPADAGELYATGYDYDSLPLSVQLAYGSAIRGWEIDPQLDSHVMEPSSVPIEGASQAISGFSSAGDGSVESQSAFPYTENAPEGSGWSSPSSSTGTSSSSFYAPDVWMGESLSDGADHAMSERAGGSQAEIEVPVDKGKAPVREQGWTSTPLPYESSTREVRVELSVPEEQQSVQSATEASNFQEESARPDETMDETSARVEALASGPAAGDASSGSTEPERRDEASVTSETRLTPEPQLTQEIDSATVQSPSSDNIESPPTSQEQEPATSESATLVEDVLTSIEPFSTTSDSKRDSATVEAESENTSAVTSTPVEQVQAVSALPLDRNENQNSEDLVREEKSLASGGAPFEPVLQPQSSLQGSNSSSPHIASQEPVLPSPAEEAYVDDGLHDEEPTVIISVVPATPSTSTHANLNVQEEVAPSAEASSHVGERQTSPEVRASREDIALGTTVAPVQVNDGIPAGTAPVTAPPNPTPATPQSSPQSLLYRAPTPTDWNTSPDARQTDEVSKSPKSREYRNSRILNFEWEEDPEEDSTDEPNAVRTSDEDIDMDLNGTESEPEDPIVDDLTNRMSTWTRPTPKRGDTMDVDVQDPDAKMDSAEAITSNETQDAPVTELANNEVESTVTIASPSSSPVATSPPAPFQASAPPSSYVSPNSRPPSPCATAVQGAVGSSVPPTPNPVLPRTTGSSSVAKTNASASGKQYVPSRDEVDQDNDSSMEDFLLDDLEDAEGEEEGKCWEEDGEFEEDDFYGEEAIYYEGEEEGEWGYEDEEKASQSDELKGDAENLNLKGAASQVQGIEVDPAVPTTLKGDKDKGPLQSDTKASDDTPSPQSGSTNTEEKTQTPPRPRHGSPAIISTFGRTGGSPPGLKRRVETSALSNLPGHVPPPMGLGMSWDPSRKTDTAPPNRGQAPPYPPLNRPSGVSVELRRTVSATIRGRIPRLPRVEETRSQYPLFPPTRGVYEEFTEEGAVRCMIPPRPRKSSSPVTVSECRDDSSDRKTSSLYSMLPPVPKALKFGAIILVVGQLFW